MEPSTPARVALVTGAGSGIGRAIALALARQGYALTLVGRRADALEASASACAPAPVRVCPVDLNSPFACRDAVRTALDGFGRLDALVNNAGVGLLRPIERTTPELLEESFRVNALAPALLVLHAWPCFERQRGGCVVNISSMATFDPYPGFFAYAASKAAMNLQAASIAKEGAAIGVRAFAIAPGAVETPMLRASFDRGTVPPEHTLDPAVVARLVVECLNHRHDHLNGRTIPVLPDAAIPRYCQWARDHSPLPPWQAGAPIG